MLAPMSVMQNHTSVQKQKEKDGTYDCIIKRDLNSPNILFFDGEVSDDLQYFPTKSYSRITEVTKHERT